MFTSTESRLWLAVHLLYPNASQAFDVYQAVVLQAEDAINQNNKDVVFAKLAQAFEKIPPISSNLSFYEFEFDQIDQWKVIYKNSQKPQLLIFVGVLIFEIKISEMAPYLKLSVDKAQFLFHQIFKKLAQSSSKLKYSEPLNFKKQNDTKISYLFTYENLVDYCLGQLSPEEQEKVKMGLELYPILQVTKDEYLKIISQIQNLKVQKSNASLPEKKIAVAAETVSAPTEEPSPFLRDKKIITALALSLVVVILVSVQLSGAFDYLLNKKRTLVIQEIDQKPEATVAAEPVPTIDPKSIPEASEILSQDQTPTAEPAESVPAVATAPATEVRVAKPEPPKPDPKTEALGTQPAQEGGLYRGTLSVSRLSEINAQLIKKVSSLGAKKAGEVELGWMKTPHMAYYHYIIPEKNVEETLAYMKKIGALNVKFEKHPRVVPAGSKRYIIEVVEKE